MPTNQSLSLTQVPIDVLKGIFEWFSGQSVDACLLRQTNRTLKWILTNQVGWKPILNPNLPFTQQLDVIGRHLPTPAAPPDLEQLKVTCLANGQLKNFEYLHGKDELTIAHLTAPVAKGHLACLKALVLKCSADFLGSAHQLLLSTAATHGVIPIAEFLYSDCHVNIRMDDEAALVRACQNNQLEMVQWLINRGADFNVNYDQPVFLATAAGHLDIVKYFHSLGANVCAGGSFAEACANGHLDVVNYLIECGANIHGLHHRPMTNAIFRNQLDIVKRLEVAGYDLTDRLFFNQACEYGRLEIVKHMCLIPGNNHAQDVKALEIASNKGHLNVVEHLYSLGADIHGGGERVIQLACQAGHIDIVQFLLSNGCDVHHDNDKLLRVACANGQLDVVKFLCSVQTNINDHEVPAVKMACGTNHIEIVKHLHAVGAIFNGPASHDYVRVSCRQGHVEIVKFLHSIGTNVRFDDDEPFRIACCFAKYDVMVFLHSIGANIHAGVEGSFIRACSSGELIVVRTLYEWGVDVHNHTEGGLQMACRAGQLSIVQYLVSLGADIHIQNDLPLQIASQYGHLDIVKFLHSKDEMSRFNNRLPAMASFSSGKVELVRYFHELGEDMRCDHNISLKRACMQGDIEIVKYLHSIGARHLQAVSIALQYGHVAVAEFLSPKSQE